MRLEENAPFNGWLKVSWPGLVVDLDLGLQWADLKGWFQSNLRARAGRVRLAIPTMAGPRT